MKNIKLVMRGILFSAFLFLFSFSSVFAGELQKITGIILDSETHKPVFTAAVQLLNEERYTITNESGYFEFKNLSDSIHTIRITHLSYNEKIIKLSDFKKEIVIYLIPKSIEISTVVVTEHNSTNVFDEIAEVTSVLKGRDLEKDLGLTLASTLKNETGIAMRSMGPAPARPVIRGLGSDRVLISEDGTKTTDLSATSPDHAVTIEPFNIDRIEVIRGPKILTQTSTTIGGVVNVNKKEVPEQLHESVFGKIGAYGETANKGFLGSAIFEVPVGSFQFRGELSKRKTGDISTPAGVLKNSNSENLNYSTGGSYISSFGFAGLSFRNYQLDYGVPGGFLGAHPNGVDITLKRQQINFKSRIDIHSKSINHIKVDFSGVYYRHKEFEKSGSIGSEFEITNHLGDISVDHKHFLFAKSGTAGVSFEYRDFVPGGFVFTPPSKSLKLSGYLFEEIDASKFHFEFGARVNYDSHKPSQDKPNSNIGYIRERDFTTYSLSFSALYPLTKIVSIGINLSKSSRVPTLEELFSEGPHLAAYSYEIGNPDLKAESGFGSEFFVYHKYKNLFYNFNFFYNRLTNYIIPRNTGETNWATFLPIYKTFGVNAALYGAEGQIEWGIGNNFSLYTSLSYTQGIFTETNSPLPQIPPFKGIIGIDYKTDNLSIGINSEMAADQNKVDEFEQPTAGYVILNFQSQYSFVTYEFIHNISLSIDNILNTEYRNHLSRVKVILPEAGISARLTYKLYFHL